MVEAVLTEPFKKVILVVLAISWILLETGGGEAAFETERLVIGGEVRERYEFRENADFSTATNDTLGRQEMAFGDHWLVGNFGWGNVGRSFDGLRVTSMLSLFRMDLWAAVTKKFGANIGADPAFSPVTAPAARGQDRVTLGLRLDGKAVGDSVDFRGEVAYQTGSMKTRGTTPKRDISAYACAVKAGYTLPVSMKPRVGIEYDRASGDDDPGDDTFETFENLFPTNHIHYGYMDYIGWRNMQNLHFSTGLKPSVDSGVSLDYHLFWLAEESDHWYAASGRIFRTTPAGNSETELGQEIDLVAYMMVREKFRLEAGLSLFFPGDYVETNFPTATADSDFVYLQTGVGF